MEINHFLVVLLSLIITTSYGENSTPSNYLEQTSIESGTTLASSTSTTLASDILGSTTIQIQQAPTQQQQQVINYTQATQIGSVVGTENSLNISLSTSTVPGSGSGVIQQTTEPVDTTTEVILFPGPDQKELIGIQKALDWLKEKRLPDYGWANDTHMVILAKELSGSKDSTDPDNHVQVISDLEDLLSIKQMEIEILSMLDRYYGNDELSIPNINLNLTFHSSRHHTVPKPINADKIARYVLTLASLCKDPKQFYGHDLVATLQHHEPVQDQEFALATLAVCSSAAHVRKRQIRRLLDIASGGTDQSVDTVAMVILALRCIVTDHRHRHLQHFVRRPTRGLASVQDPRGGFGSLRSTALAIQALQDFDDTELASTWNRSAASKWLLDRQRADGGWTEEPLKDGQDPSIGIGLTADIILALGWKGLSAVRALQCDHVLRETSDYNGENGEPKLAAPVGLPSSAEEGEPKNVSYTYTLWVGTNVTEAFSLSLISSKNTSFFRAMKQAAALDPRFAFEAREWPNGHYVHTLAEKKEEPKGYNYWLLYRLPELPDPSNPPGNQLIAPVGVDELMVEDGEHYLYWYKKL